MTNLCITLRSIYSAEDDPHGELNQEVEIDSETIRAALDDHKIVEITIPTRASRDQVDQIIRQYISEISLSFQYCHIVLNTHGVPGRSDLMNGAVQEVIKHLSHRNTSVTQISALQCNGMQNRFSDAQEKGYTNIGRPSRPSCLQRLKSKLEHTQTSIPQSFKIYGFLLAYDPIVDKHKVVALLQGVGISLVVNTHVQPPITHADYLREIGESINEVLIEKIEGAQVTDTYSKATNVLGNVFKIMKENIKAYLQGDAELAFENKALYDRLCLFAEQSTPTIHLNAQEFDNICSQWFKTYKVRSHERLDVLKDYCISFSVHHGIFEKTIEDSVPSSAAEGVLPYNRYRFIKSVETIETAVAATDVTSEETSISSSLI